jgi:hypothetical protein
MEVLLASLRESVRRHWVHIANTALQIKRPVRFVCSETCSQDQRKTKARRLVPMATALRRTSRIFVVCAHRSPRAFASQDAVAACPALTQISPRTCCWRCGRSVIRPDTGAVYLNKLGRPYADTRETVGSPLHPRTAQHVERAALRIQKPRLVPALAVWLLNEVDTFGLSARSPSSMR